MGPIVYGFEGRGSLNRSRFLVYSPLSRLLNVPPYSPTSIDTHYASFMVLPPGTFFFFRISWVKVYFYLFVVGKRRPKKWPLFHGLTGVSAFFPLISVGGSFGFTPSLLSAFVTSTTHTPRTIFINYNPTTHHPSTTTIRSFSSSSCIHPPPTTEGQSHTIAPRTLSFHYPTHSHTLFTLTFLLYVLTTLLLLTCKNNRFPLGLEKQPV